MIRYFREGQFPEAGLNFGLRRHGFVLCWMWPNFAKGTVTRWRFRFRAIDAPRFLWKREAMALEEIVLRGGERVLVSLDAAQDAKIDIHKSTVVALPFNLADGELAWRKEQMKDVAMKKFLDRFDGMIFGMTIQDKKSK